MRASSGITVRNTRPEDFPSITALCERVYPETPPWDEKQLRSHLELFPEGQFVAVRDADSQVVGMAASLIVLWEDYDLDSNWRDLTARGYFTNHDPVNGRTLYGAEIMVAPETRGSGAGSRIYSERRKLAERLGLLRIRAGARLRDYNLHADKMSAEEYVRKVVHGELKDRTLSFQLRRGFRVLAVVAGYLGSDPSSLGYAAVIEWLNAKVATEEELQRQRAGIHAHHLD